MKKYFILAAAALSFAACSNNESDNQVQNPDNVIRLNASVGDITRAATNIQSQAFDEDALINIEVTPSATNTTISKVYKAGAAVGNVNSLTPNGSETPFTWPATGTVAIKAFYPSTVKSADTSFSVQENQSTDANYKASDLMYATPIATQAKTSETVGLTFNHALTKIIVNLTKGTGVTDDDIAGCTVKVNAKKSANISSGQWTSATDDAAVDITMGIGANNAAIIVPQSYVANANFITIKTGNGDANHTKIFQLSAEKTFQAGKVYTYNLTVNMSEITLQSTTINNWDSQEAIPGNVEI